jgi:hypothetical protein
MAFGGTGVYGIVQRKLDSAYSHDAYGHDQDILYWWKEHSPKFLSLLKITRQFLAVPASFVGAKRLLFGFW